MYVVVGIGVLTCCLVRYGYFDDHKSTDGRRRGVASQVGVKG